MSFLNKKNIFVVVILVLSNILHAEGPYDGGIIAGDQHNAITYIFDSNKKNLNDAVLWSWSKPSNPEDLEDELLGGGTDIKRVKGGSHVLMVRAGKVVLINIATKAVEFYAKPGGNPHSCELLPDGNIATASSDGNSIKIFYTGGGNKPDGYEYTFGGAHGVVWDNKRQLLWAIGGSKLWSFTYNFDSKNPSLKVKNKYEIEPSGHDLFPVPGQDKLYYTSKNIWIFDIKTGTSSLFFAKGAKSVSQNGPQGEVIYTRGEGNNAKLLGIKKWQTPTIQSIDGNKRTFEGAGFYKARWFIPSEFSYPEVVNNAPVWSDESFKKKDAIAGTHYNGWMGGKGSDPDGDELVFFKVSGPEWLTVGNTGTLEGTPDLQDVGVNEFQLGLSDGVDTVFATMNINVLKPDNTAPYFTRIPLTKPNAVIGQLYESGIRAHTRDAEGDDLTYKIIDGPAWLSMSETGQITGTPKSRHHGVNTFKVEVTDGELITREDLIIEVDGP